MQRPWGRNTADTFGEQQEGRVVRGKGFGEEQLGRLITWNLRAALTTLASTAGEMGTTGGFEQTNDL